MKKINEAVEWALHCCIILAASKIPLTADRLAEFHGIPRDYLAKALQALSKAGVLIAVRGANGGYRLRGPADSISVLEIVRVLEPGPRFSCTEIRQNGPSGCPGTHYKGPCSVRRLMSRAEAAWADVLAATTLRELAVTAEQNAPRSQLEKTINWLKQPA